MQVFAPFQESSPVTVRRGFTLIELLVVISIIALLSAICFPVFSRVRENARRSSCISNLKQIALAMQQYMQDYDGCFSIQDVTLGKEKGFANALHPYSKADGLFLCPSAKGTVTSESPFDDQDHVWNYGGILGSYSMNTQLEGTNIAKVSATSQTPLFNDNRWFSDSGIPANARYATRHFDGLNVVFVDGHTKWFNLQQAETTLNFSP